MINEQTLEERVELGAAVLDDRLPEWEHNIDFDSLDMKFATSCVVRQADITLRRYTETLQHLFPNRKGFLELEQAALEHGFSLRDGLDEEWDQLTVYWIGFIDKRLLRKEQHANVHGGNPKSRFYPH